MKIGIIGLGNMGSRMAEKLSKSGVEVFGFDAIAEKVDSGIKSGMLKGVLDDETVSGIAHFIISLPTENSITEILNSMNFSEGTVIIDMSTVSMYFSKLNHQKMIERNIRYIDAPVIGMPAGIGSWTIPVGGEKGHYESALPFLKFLGKNIEYMGSSGSGSLIKILNNMISLSAWATISEVVVIADKMGIDLKQLYNIIKSSGGGAVSLMLDRIPRIAENDYKNICSVDVNIKDLEAAYSITKEIKIPSLMVSAALNLHLMAHQSGYGNYDMNAIVLAFEDFRKKHEGF
jgi:3-hydroxyisobutyrate dehydrogenase-like beta-hydroxyacid dehydrogenase